MHEKGWNILKKQESPHLLTEEKSRKIKIVSGVKKQLRFTLIY